VAGILKRQQPIVATRCDDVINAVTLGMRSNMTGFGAPASSLYSTTITGAFDFVFSVTVPVQ